MRWKQWKVKKPFFVEFILFSAIHYRNTIKFVCGTGFLMYISWYFRIKIQNEAI